ncbi:FK506-binding protein 15 isoform X2 [Denticeps clupeoides]|uniref:peptidylprolyl isomerase n=1 Tax=Denticeps clupeoides TaxID=299321 RepID=A0AAY4DM17_9TELE|nr:FK506-binding protein 15 isoform X2 [Denticeps clupeoides]
MFATDDEDGDFMSPTGGAKLASLFGLDQAANQGNESFQYTAPKQPKKTSTNSGPPTQKPAPPTGSPAVLLATAVHAYRYVNGQYMKQGKLGAAVLGTHATKEYKLLLYASQQKPVTSAKIHAGFIFTVQPSNYCTFYDDQRQNWSVMFDSEKSAVDFCREVCLAKANSTAPLDNVVVQDLALGEGQAVENGDLLEVAYTGWLLQNQVIGQLFDSNLNKDKLLKMKLGAGKVIKGWEEGMLGMRKGGHRILVIPPMHAYGSQGVPNCIPPDSTLVFEAEVRRVKLAKDGCSERLSVGSHDSSAPSPAPSVENLGPDITTQVPSVATGKPGDPPLRAKSNSLSEQLTNPDATKAKLISRMAKMGQPMLPFLAGPASSSSQADSSDSELEDHSVSRVKDHPVLPSPQPVHITSAPLCPLQVTTHAHANPTAALMPVSMAPTNPQPLMQSSLHAFQPVNQVYQSQTVPYQAPGDVTSFLMTEARQHNTEIRLAVGKVADKIDQLASKVDDMQKQGGITSGLSNVSMETAMIMHNIQRIIQENECLKKEVFEKSSRIEEQNRKIGELINQNQRYMEHSNLLMEERNNSMKNSSEQNQARVLQAEQDKARLTEELASLTARLSELQLEASTQHQKAAALQAKLNSTLQDGEQSGAQISTLQTQLEECKEAGDRSQAQYKTEKQKRKELEIKLTNMEEELQDLKTEKDSLERTLSDRKRKWHSERQRCDEELEEVRKNSQQELDNLRSQLRKSRTSTDQAAQEQMVQLQAELQQEWQLKCDQALALAREQQARQVTELTEQKDNLQHKLSQLQEKFTALKHTRDSEEQSRLQQQDQGEELEALREKYSAFESRSVSMRQQFEARVSDLERRLAEKQEQGDTIVEVKRVMNGVFHSLRAEFDLNETYSGSTVITVLVNTIKNVTLQLLSATERTSSEQSAREEEEEEEGEEEQPQAEEKHVTSEAPLDVQVNGNNEADEQEQRIQEEGQSAKEEKLEEEEHSTVLEKTRQESFLEEQLEKEVVTENKESIEEAQQETQQFETSVKKEVAVDVDVASGDETETESAQQSESKPVEDLVCDSELTIEPPSEDGCMPKGNTSNIVDEAEPMECRSGPPTQPPPSPGALPEKSSSTSLTEGVEEENGAEPFFQNAAPLKPPPAPNEEDEDELSLKGRPPPAPLFGDDEDDDDLDWLA